MDNGLSEGPTTVGSQVDIKDSTESEFGLTVVGRLYIKNRSSLRNQGAFLLYFSLHCIERNLHVRCAIDSLAILDEDHLRRFMVNLEGLSYGIRQLPK